MERHPLGSQAFIPLHQRPFPIIVSTGSDHPKADSIKAFISNGHQGVNLARGTWHHYQVTLDNAGEYIVIDREGPGDNLDEWKLGEPASLEI
jgi:ureidoglycolate lyase